MVRLWDSTQGWFKRHEWINAILTAIVIVAIVVLILSALISIGNNVSGYDALRAECLQYETIGDMPAKCLDVFD